ncbi:hypothetical protein HYR99_38670 [Candidatus Poribacteria bacterium]|nr:hypothetical protein [Candidatus Poribacteria bacterium]
MQTLNRKIFTVRNYWHRFRRRKWIVVIPLLISTIIAIFVSLMTTPVYRATTTLVAEATQLGGNVVDGFSIVPIPEQERFTLIQHRILSRGLLMEVAEALQLRDYLGRQKGVKSTDTGVGSTLKKLKASQTQLTDEQMLQYLRDAISIGLRSTVIEIHVMHSNPQLAMEVANQLARTYVDDARRRRSVQVNATQEFVLNQIREFQERLEQSDQALEKAKESRQPGFSHLVIEKKQIEEIYALLLERLHEINLLSATERQQMGNVAEVLDEAILPEHPITTNKKKIVAAGIVIGLGLGLILLFTSAFIDWPSIQPGS